MAYQRPMVTVDQNMTITPTSIERDQPAFIFGPNYELHRYSDPEEKPKTKIGTFTNGEIMEVAYPFVVDDSKVDKDYTRLFGDNVVVELEKLADAELPERNLPETARAKNGGYTKILFPLKNYVDKYPAGSSSPTYDGAPVKLRAGDRLMISYVDKIGLDSSDSSSFESKATTVFTTVSRVENSIRYDGSGFDLDNIPSDSSPYEGGPGTLVIIDDAIPESVDVASGIIVSVVDVMNNVEFTRKNLAESVQTPGAARPVPAWQWEQDSFIPDGGSKKINGIRVNGELHVLVQGYFDKEEYCTVVSADLFVTYRELSTSYADTFHNVTGASEVENVLGTVTPDNPLAMGVYMAALNSATDDGDEAPPIYFMAIQEPGLAGYQKVLDKATTTDKAYVFAPTTRDKEVLEAVRTHCLDMSTKTEKQWRIAFVSSEIPETVNVLDSLLDPQGDDFLAIPVAEDGSTATSGTNFNTLRVVRASDDIRGNVDAQLSSNVVVGDRVRFAYRQDEWDEWKYDTYVITKVVNNYTVEVNTDEGYIAKTFLSPVDGGLYFKPSKIEIFHTYTSKESADEIASISKAWSSRRMYNVFPSVFEYNGVKMTGEFAACGVAGLVSATEPQQPITNMSVRGIDNIPMTYQTYNKYELDTIAAGGTFIVAQDLPNDKVYVRHQISTAYPDGNLNTAELSVTKNVDSISYAFAEVFRPYYGKYNITPELIAILENLAGQLISQLAGSTSVYGPQVIAENTRIRYVRQNELMKDHVDIAITLGVPYPCNVIDIVLTV